MIHLSNFTGVPELSELQKLALEVGGNIGYTTDAFRITVKLDDHRTLFVYGNDRRHMINNHGSTYPINWIEAHKLVMEVWHQNEANRKFAMERSKQEKANELGLTVEEYDIMLGFKNTL